MTEQKFFTSKYDLVFKNVVMKEPIILKRLLEDILGEKIDEITILDKDLSVKRISQKGKIVDALIKIGNKYINIEVNNNLKPYTHDRNFLYACNILSQNINKGKEYTEIPKLIQINLTWGVKSNRPYEVFELRSKNNIFSEIIKIIEVYMDFHDDMYYNGNNKFILEHKTLIMLNRNKEELEKLSKGDDIVSLYKECVTKLNEDVEFKPLMSDEEDRQMCYNSDIKIATNKGIEKGIEKGIKRGIEEGKLETAREMLKNNIDIDTIIKCTALTRKQIDKLIIYKQCKRMNVNDVRK